MVSIHNEMYTDAAQVLRNLKQTLTEAYSEEVGDALMDKYESEPELSSYQGGTSSFSGISLDVSDRYLNGQGNFVILVMDKIGQNLKQVRGHGEDARSLQLRSTASDMTGRTGTTIPQPPGEGDNMTEASGRTTIPSVGPTSIVTAASEFNSPQWQLKGDTEAEIKMRRLVIEAKEKQDAMCQGNEKNKTPEDNQDNTVEQKGEPPDTPPGSEGSAVSL